MNSDIEQSKQLNHILGEIPMTPTILIPGIKGTKLANINTLNFDVIWSGLKRFYESITDLELDNSAKFDCQPGAIIERLDVEDLAYHEIVFSIIHKTKSPVYIFGYDWRKTCAENGKKLFHYVEYLREKLKVNKFNFITHSMGGIVFLCFLNNLSKQFDIVEHAILTVCPFEGSINSLIALILGEGGLKFPLFNSSDMFRKIARSFPSVYELIPTYPEAISFSDGDRFDIYNSLCWQENISKNSMFIIRLEEFKNFKETNHSIYDLRDLPTEVGQRFLILVGEGEKTKNKVIVYKELPDCNTKNFFDFNQKESDCGDGVVPFESSTIYKDVILTISFKSRWYDKATHSFFLNDGRVQTIINRFIMDETKESNWWKVIGDSVRKL